MSRLILDLCGGSGAWSMPYRFAGYRVQVIDTLHGEDVLEYEPTSEVHGVLAAPPCTKFSYARNRYPLAPDELEAALAVVDACLRVVDIANPVWWALENPLNKLRRWLGDPVWVFRQWEYGDDGVKPTALWGDFRPPMKRACIPRHKSTWRSKRANATANMAITPPGFANAFFEANP